MRQGRTPTLEELERQMPALDSYLSGLNADKLKKLARLWVGKDVYKMNKDMALAAVRKCFDDADAIRAMVTRLSDFERAGLGLIKRRDGRLAYTEALAGELLMLGLPFKGQRDGLHDYYYGAEDAHYSGVNALLDTGLLIRLDGSGQPIGQYSSSLAVFADERVLAAIEPMSPQPLAIKPVAQDAAGWVRRPGEVSLRLVAFVQALRDVGGIALSAKGLRAKPAVAKLAKALGWNEEPATPAPTALADPLGFYLSLWEAAGLLRAAPGTLLLTDLRRFLIILPLNQCVIIFVWHYSLDAAMSLLTSTVCCSNLVTL